MKASPDANGPNATLLVAGYGSLLSGYGLLAVRRGGGSKLVARDAFPILLGNARRGLAKPSSHGRYLAMDIEPIDPGRPISASVANRTRLSSLGRNAVGALALVFDRSWARQIARREEYRPDKFIELIESADRAGQPLGEFLLAIARRVNFSLLDYRRALFEMLGYTSRGYIFHPLPLEDGRVAIVAIGSGFDGTGDPALRSRRNECGMDRLLTLPEAMEVTSLDLDRESQLGYFVECVLGVMHGLPIGDLTRGLDGVSGLGRELERLLARARDQERDHFLTATALSPEDYESRFAPTTSGRLPRSRSGAVV